MSEYRQYPRLNGLSMRRVSRYMELLAKEAESDQLPAYRQEAPSHPRRRDEGARRSPAIPDPWDIEKMERENHAAKNNPVALGTLDWPDAPQSAAPEATQGIAAEHPWDDEPVTVGFGHRDAPRVIKVAQGQIDIAPQVPAPTSEPSPSEPPEAPSQALDVAFAEPQTKDAPPIKPQPAAKAAPAPAKGDVIDYDWDALLDIAPPVVPDWVKSETMPEPSAPPVVLEPAAADAPPPATQPDAIQEEGVLSEEELARAMAALSWGDDEFLVTGVGKPQRERTEPAAQPVAGIPLTQDPVTMDADIVTMEADIVTMQAQERGADSMAQYYGDPEDEDSPHQIKRQVLRLDKMRTAIVVLVILSVLSLGALAFIYFFTDLLDSSPGAVDAYMIYLDEEKMGTVLEGKAVVAHIEAERAAVQQRTGMTAVLGRELRMEPTRIEKNFIAPAQDMAAHVSNRCAILVEAAGIYVDGRLVGAAASREVVDQVMNEALSPFEALSESRQVTDVGFAETVEIRPVQVSPSQVLDEDQVRRLLIKGQEENLGAAAEMTARMVSAEPAAYSQNMVYQVKEGDSLSVIASTNNLTLSQLRYANPALIGHDLIRPGMELSVTPPQGLLTVQFTETVEKETSLPYETVTKTSSKLYTTQKKVEQEGKKGVRKVVAERIYIAGVLAKENILSETVVSQPVDEIIVKGTKKATSASKTSSTRYIWPASGKKSSGFGPRWGSSHKGLDIAAAKGTPIYAARDGKVTFSGTNGTYGKLIKIDHGGGVETRYAHCSVLKVSKGTYVKQGQLIALVGSTGRSTGNHLHFEVRVNGVAKDPEKYLPK